MSLTKVSFSMIDGARVNVLDFGADPTGVQDSTSAIQSAIDKANSLASNTVVVPAGTYIVSSNLTYLSNLTIIGLAGDYLFTNSFADHPVTFICNGVTGYLFDQPDVVNGNGALSIANMSFEGRVASVASTTWSGLVRSSTTAGLNSFWLRLNNVMVGGSDSATPILDLNGQVFSEANNCFFANWINGMGVSTGSSSVGLSTTITFNKCYWNSLRQVGQILSNAYDVQFNNCVLESCIVCLAVEKADVVLNQCYSENIGFDPAGLGRTTGLTPRNFGNTFSPDITGDVVAAHTCMYGQMVFNQYTITNTTGGKKWFEGLGRSSSAGFGGLIDLKELVLAAGTISTLFAVDTGDRGNQFDYIVNMKLGTAFLTNAEARQISSGRVPLLWSDGNVRLVNVSNGLYEMPPESAFGIVSVPTIFPAGGTNVVGDKIFLSASQQSFGKRNSYVCNIAGSTGSKWQIYDFIPSTKRATVAAAGTMEIVASAVDNPGELHIWEITGSTGSPLGANMLSLYRLHVQAFSGVGQIYAEGLITTNTLTFSMSWGAAYTITITNTSGVTVELFARLISVSSVNT